MLQVLEDAGVLRQLFVLCNDSLAAFGVQAWLRASVPGLEARRTALVASPFRNLRGFEQRLAQLGLNPPFDPNAIEPLVARTLESLQPAPAVSRSAQTVDVSAGRGGLLETFWRRHGGPRELVLTPASARMDYELDSAATSLDVPAKSRLEELLRALHEVVGNAAVQHHHLVLGSGSRQVVLAALHAAWRRAGRPVRVVAAAPFYPFHARLAGMAPGIATWGGARFEGDGGAATPELEPGGPTFELISSPANPTGLWDARRETSGPCLFDLAYHWPHLAPQGALPLQPRADALMAFSLSKLTGHAASRVGWAWVEDEQDAAVMRHFIRHDTIGPSGDALARAEVLISALLRDGGALYRTLADELPRTMRARWQRLLPVLNAAGLSCRSRTDGWCYALLAVTPAQDEALRSAGIRGYAGARMGAPGLIRLNLLGDDATFEALVSRLAGLGQPG